MSNKEKGYMEFRVDSCQLLNEIVDCAIPKNMGVLKIPLNIFKNHLAMVAERASELNDPELNILMLQMGLYEVGPTKIIEAIENQRKLLNKGAVWVSVNDKANPIPNKGKIEIMFKNGEIRDYDTEDWTWDEVTHWRVKATNKK